MDLEEILRLDMCPFDDWAMEGHFRNDTDGALSFLKCPSIAQ